MTPMVEALGEKAGGGEDMSPPTALNREVWRLIRVMGPVKIRELCRITGASRRDIEAAVEALRLAGDPIVADNDGLRMTEDPDELRAYVDARRRRAVSIYLGTRALRKAAGRLQEAKDAEGGLTLWRVA